ncbi:MAG: hypothetical protein J0H98_10700 [Solirubrobacterales bacterium]|nr:hypothetical protein [Solirubrobacterales bacterium]
MKRTEAAELFTRLIEQQEKEGRDEKTPCLMLTGTWHEAFPPAPPVVASLTSGRAIYLLNLAQARAIQQVLSETSTNLVDVSIEISSKANPRAITDRQKAWQRERIRSLVRRTPGARATRYLREERP